MLPFSRHHETAGAARLCSLSPQPQDAVLRRSPDAPSGGIGRRPEAASASGMAVGTARPDSGDSEGRSVGVV